MKKSEISAAVQLFAAEGYKHVSMRKIAHKIEYSTTAINYFANKKQAMEAGVLKMFSICSFYIGIAAWNNIIVNGISRVSMGLERKIELLKASSRGFLNRKGI